MQTPPKPWLTLSDGSPLTRQEQFVLRQVAAGEIADLKQEFGEAEGDRRLRAQFLEELLDCELKEVKIHRWGILINNAVIEGPLDLENSQISVRLGLNASIFKGRVSLKDARLKFLSLNGSHFLNGADFNRIKIGISFFCQKTIFEGAVDFGFAQITEQLVATNTKFLSKDQDIIFGGIKVGQGARFDGAEFNGAVVFTASEIRGQFGLEKAKFLADKYGANFNRLQVGQSIRLDEAEFHGSVDFINACIKGQFIARGAKFFSSNNKVSFYGMKVGREADFQSCDFHGLVSFILIRIARDLHLEPMIKSGPTTSTIFRSSVNFDRADIGGEFLAFKAQFLGHISNFEGIRVGRSFHASGAIFGGSAYFTEMAVKNNFYIDPFGRLKSFKTLFKGPANFSRLEVGGVFNADQAIFKSDSVIFSGLKVGLGAFFNGTIFFSGLVLKEGQLTDLVIRGLHRLSKGGLPLDEIVLNRTRIEHRLTVEDIEVKRFHARHLEVQGPAELRRLAIKKEADLRDAALNHLQIVETHWPEPRDGKEKTYLDGLAYQSITTKIDPDKAEKWPELLAWLGLSRFNTQNYQDLDAYLQRCGLRKWADRVYIAGKRRELSKLSRWNPARWLTKFFWGLLAGYARKPVRVVWISLGIILLGACIMEPAQMLTPGMMQTIGFSPNDRLQSLALRVILSLYGFLSGIPGWSGHLQIQTPDFFTFIFLWLQRICGWILIPIGLAALYSRLK